MSDQDKDLSEAKRIMGRLVNTPPKPHKVKTDLGDGKVRRAVVAEATDKKKKAAKPPSE